MTRGRVRQRLTYANVTATIALIVALVGSTSAVAAVIISSNSQVARNTISGHHSAVGQHANVIAGSINATDISPTFLTSLKDGCPAGLHRGGDLCFDVNNRSPLDWPDAEKACFAAHLRLPTTSELMTVYDHLGTPQLDWAEEFQFNASIQEYEAPEITENTTRLIGFSLVVLSDPLPYRCVTGASN